ncbi:hypothetical protein BBO_07934 [Beauveria brongniartii RCEF 3172]|uniref:Uncharacterized protein n=1 Tax=Beauveria brongniartii RCEF 3172 TaxID=1081107 RepID=A0A166YJ05_9HYPO|nr:hypothetical protein BBO_07934 [Beauveria brongniartii RCEF 3172]
MAKDSDPDARDPDRADTNTPAAASPGSQSMLCQRAIQNRYSLPVPVPERSASMAYESVLLPSVSSAPPRLDALPDFALNGWQRSSTFRDGLEKAVNDINTKYGDSTKTSVNSTSPTNSVAVLEKNLPKTRCMVPIYGGTPNARPVIGELWTALKSQEETVKESTTLKDDPKQNNDDSAPRFHGSQKIDTEPNESGTDNLAIMETGDDANESTSQSAAAPASQSNSFTAKVTGKSTEASLKESNSCSDDTESDNARAEPDVKCQDKPPVGHTEAAPALESIDEDTLHSKEADSASALSQSTSCDQFSAATKDSAISEADPEYGPRPTEATRGRNFSAPSVAALVSKFRRMEQPPENAHHSDGTQEQDEVSVESNSRFIQSYRQRSEDTDNENSLLSTVSSDNASNERPSLAVF